MSQKFQKNFLKLTLKSFTQNYEPIKELEANLLGHPLALFPTLENGLSPELYEEIVDILEPDLLDMSDSETEESPSSVEPVLPPINAKG